MNKQKILSVILGALFAVSSVFAQAKTYTEQDIEAQVKAAPFSVHAFRLNADDTVDLPSKYKASIVTNPETGQRFLKIPAMYEERGIKKAALVSAFRHGGRALATVLDVVSPATATYIRRNSAKIANSLDKAAHMLHGEIYQALLAGGIPNPHARNIAWAIDKFLL